MTWMLLGTLFFVESESDEDDDDLDEQGDGKDDSASPHRSQDVDHKESDVALEHVLPGI